MHVEILGEESTVAHLIVYDVRGREVRTLLSGQTVEPGPVVVPWDATDESGRRVASGVYLFRLKTGVGERVVKGVLVK